MEARIKNTHDKKLRKDFELILPKELVNKKIDDYIAKIQGTFNLNGFRKGQVPVSVIKDKHGSAIMIDEVEKLISENIKKIVADNKIKLALQPKVDLKKIEMGHDVEVTLIMELFPEVPEIDVKKVKVVKKEIEIAESELGEEFKKFAKYFCTWDKQDAGYKAKLKDAVKLDYVGKIDKKEFEGGSAKDFQLELGSKSFIDDFEEQLVGKKAGDETRVKVKFPKEYHKAEYAGKAAEFDVKINEVLTAEMPKLDDEFLKNNFGMENKDKLMEAVKKQIEDNYNNMSRNLFKQELFDFWNKKHDFELPTGLVEEQLKSLWAETEEELKQNPEKFKNEKEQEKAKEKKRDLAVRMIRCGMILSDLSSKHKIEVTNDDVNKELGKVLGRFPGQEQMVLEYYQKNQNAVQQLRGSILEEKTIDFLLGQPGLEKKKTSLKDFDKIWQKANEE